MDKQILILVVDDNLATLKQISALLTSQYKISLAKSGEMALQICRQEKPDMILLDVEMPGMNGFETITKLRQDTALCRIPVIFLTSNHDINTKIKALESGAIDFITKPPHKDILLHRISLHLQLSAYQQSLEKTVSDLENSIVTSFAELVDCKDRNTGKHLLQTSKFVEMLALELLKRDVFVGSLTETDIEMMIRATPFHDIGKIGISDIILEKPGSLTEEEYEEVKQHTVIGAQVIDTIYKRTPALHYMECAKLIALNHHERYDGKGYPYGLSKEDIPLCARIVSVANVYNSCMTERVYRRALSHEEACQIIIGGKGTEFDPNIIEVFELIQTNFKELNEMLV